MSGDQTGRLYEISVCPRCGEMEQPSPVPGMLAETLHREDCEGPENVTVTAVRLSDVREALERGYAPQNPTVHHPTDWIEQWFGVWGETYV